jgi:hypothetical protein
MAIDYVLDLSCPVKQAVPTPKLVGLVKTKNQAAAILHMARGKADTRAPSEIRITRRVQTPQGIQDRSITIQEMLDAASELTPLENHCNSCRANVLRRPFGCYGSIAYPIKATTEEWIMSLLPEALSCTAGRLMVSAIKDFQYNGQPIANMRQQQSLFESRKHVKRQWGSWASKTTITSDQIFQIMFCMRLMDPSHCMMIALFLGLLPHAIDLQELGDTESLNRLLTVARIQAPRPERQLEEVVLFLRAVTLAPVLDARLLTDA